MWRSFHPINHGFDEMKQFAAYYPGVYAYSDTAPIAHPWFPKYNAEYWDMYQKVVNMYEYGKARRHAASEGQQWGDNYPRKPCRFRCPVGVGAYIKHT